MNPSDDAEEEPETFSAWLSARGFPHTGLTPEQLDGLLALYLDRQAGGVTEDELVAEGEYLDPDSELD